MQQSPMLFSDRFQVLGELGEGAGGIVYEAMDVESGALVALKALSTSNPEQVYWLKSEFRRLADVHHRNLIRFGELFVDAGRCYFTMELIRGTDFRSYVRPPDADSRSGLRSGEGNTTDDPQMSSGHGGASEALRVASRAASISAHTEAPLAAPTFDEVRLRDSLEQLAEAIAAVHAQGLVHRDLKPSNVLVETTGRVIVLDFGIAGTLHQGDGDDGDGILGTPSYMAPEQVLGEAPSAAADWYAFGVMLFQSLTGRLPFEGAISDVLEAKVACEAPRPSALVGGIPPDLDALCTALLATDAQLRPSGEQVLAALARGKANSAMSPGRQTATRVFVGRALELERLHRAFDVTLSDRFAGILIEGPPGTGKTELAENFFASLRKVSATVLRGRCYEQEFVPLKGFDALLDATSHHLKNLTDDEVTRLLPPRPALLAALFPVLYRVPSVAAAVPPLKVNESKPEQREEAMAQLAQLFGALARRNPLVLFIDDLQWAGPDSLEMLRGLFTRPDAPPVLLVCTRRTAGGWEPPMLAEDTRAASDEAPSADTAMSSVFEQIRLEPLSAKDSSELLRQIWPEAKSMEEGRLSRVLAEAAGYPLFLQELALYARGGSELGGALRLDQVLQERIGRLEAPSRRLLEVVALAGVPLPARVLGSVAQLERRLLGSAVAVLRSEQLIRVTRTDANHRMLEPYHDRIREAVVRGARSGSYPLASGRDVSEVHLELARALLRAHVEENLPVATTTIANQYNLGASAIRSLHDRRQAIRLGLEAAKQMKLASAYGAAARFIEGARRHADSASDDDTRELRRQLDLLEMEIALLADDADLARGVFERLVAKSRDDLELAEVYETRAAVETAKNRHSAAIATACEGLGRLSMRFPRKGSALLLLVEIALLWLKLLGRVPASLIHLPAVSDDRVRAQMRLLAALGPAAYFVDVNLMMIVTIRVARTSLSRGLTDFSAYAFMGYAIVLAGAFQRYRRAFEFGLLAMALNERFQNRSLDAKLVYIHAAFVCAFIKPLEEAARDMRRVMELGLANGDLTYRTYAAATIPSLSFTAGNPLDRTEAESVEGLRVARQEGNVDQAAQTDWGLRATRCLRGQNENPRCMDGDSTEEQLLRETEQGNLVASHFAYGLTQLVLGCHLGDDPLAAKGAERADRHSHAAFGLFKLVDLCFYQTLVMCTALAQRPGFFTRFRLRLAIRRRLRKLEKWAEASDANYAGHFLMARGEYRRVVGERDAARRDLADATEHAERRETHHVAALAHERLAAWHHTYGTAAGMRASLEAAAEAYRRWGAEACVSRLRAQLEHIEP